MNQLCKNFTHTEKGIYTYSVIGGKIGVRKKTQVQVRTFIALFNLRDISLKLVLNITSNRPKIEQSHMDYHYFSSMRNRYLNDVFEREK